MPLFNTGPYDPLTNQTVGRLDLPGATYGDVEAARLPSAPQNLVTPRTARSSAGYTPDQYGSLVDRLIARSAGAPNAGFVSPSPTGGAGAGGSVRGGGGE